MRWLKFEAHLFVVALVVMSLGITSSAAAQLQGSGASRVITPTDLSDMYIAGFGNGRLATGVQDDIYARAFALRDGDDELIVVVLDTVGWMSWRVNPLKERLLREDNIDPNSLIICATHNHEAPDTMGYWGEDFFTSGIVPAWMDFIDDQIVAAVREARANYEPVQVRFGLGQAPGLARDSRDPQVIDEDVTTIQSVGMDGNVVATLVNYANHPEVLWSRNTLITSDYPGFTRRRIEEIHGGVAVFVSGSLGGLLTPSHPDHTFAQAKNLGDEIADIAIQSLTNQPLVDFDLEVEGRRLDIPISNPLYYLLTFIGIWEVDFAWFLERDLNVPTDIHYITMGSHGSMVTAFGEAFSETSFELKGNMPGQHKFFLNLANNELGYLVPEDQFTFPDNPFEPGENYEETVSPGIEAVPTLVANLNEMMGVYTPTPTPTPTATPTSTPTPRAGVLLAGFGNSDMTASQGGQVTIYALSNQSRGGRPTGRIEVLSDFRSTGVALELLDATSDLYGFTGQVPGNANPAPGAYLLQLQPYDNRGTSGLMWPYLRVNP